MSRDEDPLSISALQHYLYCPRQCALIHVERLWAENRLTAEGRLLHERADEPAIEHRHGVRTITAMPLSNAELGIAGVADITEFHASADGDRPYPVEYKRGSPKAHRADEVQLCAQALCLEAMFSQRVEKGALFYGTPRRRQVVEFDGVLRNLTLETIRGAREMIAAGQTPPAKFKAKRCNACSLLDLCQPRLFSRADSVDVWLARHLQEE